MKKKYYLGIDVSKKKLDMCLMAESKILKEETISNSMEMIESSILELQSEFSFTKQELLICCEHTGGYTYPLRCVSYSLEIALWVENPTQIKLSNGMQRGKNDRIDAQRIAMYASRFEDKAHVGGLHEKKLEELKELLCEQDLLVVDRAKYKAQLSDQGDYMDKKVWANKSKRLQSLISALDKVINDIQNQIEDIINNDEKLYRQMQLLKSVDGIGDKTALKMIIETGSFKDFTNPRKFCCHAGVAPFSYNSGASIRSKTQVSKRANKSIKTLLHLAALSILRKKGELQDYYHRKLAEGKSKMTVINAIRAKLVYRMFAVIKNNKFYQPIYLNSLA
jgi:Transposase and inactivated derivatives